MDFFSATTKYYSHWAGIDIDSVRGLRAVYSGERNVCQSGYTKQYDIYILRRDGKLIISYGDNAAPEIPAFAAELSPETSDNELIFKIQDRFGKAPGHNIKYVLGEIPAINSDARPLKPSDYPEFLAFFMENNPDCKDTGWLAEYFYELAEKEYCHGVFENGILVSATDAPDMPYMGGIVQEIGINTRADFRGKGYAKMACASFIKSLIGKGVCPQWSTAYTNAASQRLAESVGFIKFADIFTVTL